jgi:hydroxymethylbilane synthase
MKNHQLTITLGARKSPLSQAQVEEVIGELHFYHPSIKFQTTYVDTTGDIDQKTSLRGLDKTDFFTKEIDTMVLTGQCRAGIHSAKDLPEPLPKGLYLAALTKGVDSADVLVLRPGVLLNELPPQSRIATSSERREDVVRQMRSDVNFVDIRGGIGQRLAKLDKGEVDGVVIAEAALIRLKLTHLNRVKLPGPTAEFQGQLAIVVHEDDLELQTILSCIDSRTKAIKKNILYLGLNPPSLATKNIVHFPIIKINPLPFESEQIQNSLNLIHDYTHLILTSKTTVSILFEYLQHKGTRIDALKGKSIISVGKATSQCLEKYGFHVTCCAKEESSEGIITELSQLDLSQAFIFWPHSSLSRPLLQEYFLEKGLKFHACVFYHTETHFPNIQVDLNSIEEIIFTSPSCVDGFLEIFRELPLQKKLTAVGLVTEKYLKKKRSSRRE